MNILQVIPYFSPKHGGDVNVCYNLSKSLAKKGHNVTIFTTDFEFDEKYYTSLSDIQMIPFHCSINFDLFLYSPKMKKQLKNDIKNFEIIHLHGFRTYQNVIVHYYAKKFGIPYVLQAHGDIPIILEKQNLKKLYDTFWGNSILKDASKVLALNKTEAGYYQDMKVDKGKIEIVPNGIDLTEYINLPKKGQFRNKYSINNDEKIVLYVGRLHKSKGLELLIKSFSDVTKKLNDTKLVLIGPDDGYQSVLEKSISLLDIHDKVIFTGFVSTDIKKMALVDADAFVTPRFSGFPVTFLESCACGTPLITTNNGDHLNWINNNVGYVVDYDRYHLKEAILKILNDEELKKRFQDKGQKLISQMFNWTEISETVEDIYYNI